jgi:hypothetical protein
MPLTYAIDPARQLVTFRLYHWPSLTESQEALDRLSADPLLRRGVRVLVDQRLVPTVPDAEYVRRNIDNLAHRWPALRGARWAAVTMNPVTYGMGKMAEALAVRRGVEFRVFTDEDEALGWLFGHPQGVQPNPDNCPTS